jgi:glycerophosphoryl diester phosphodiesterase
MADVGPRFAFLDASLPLAIAHRGGAMDAPENTLEAFSAAVALGYRYLETDVHVSADGELVAFHDDRLDRVTDRTGELASLRWDEIRRTPVIGPDGTTGTICLLAELLEAFPDARFNIDPKADAAVEPLIGVLRAAGALERVCIGAFSDRRIARMRSALGTRLCTSLGPRGVARLRAASFGAPLGSLDAGCAQVPVRAGKVTLTDRRFVDRAHQAGLQVHVWTIDDPTEMHRLLDLGVDGIMTDRPEVLRDVLVERGAWA